MNSYNDACKEKYPKAHANLSSKASYVAEVWAETFPKQQNKAMTKLEMRKERAKLAREIDEKM